MLYDNIIVCVLSKDCVSLRECLKYICACELDYRLIRNRSAVIMVLSISNSWNDIKNCHEILSQFTFYFVQVFCFLCLHYFTCSYSYLSSMRINVVFFISILLIILVCHRTNTIYKTISQMHIKYIDISRGLSI